MIVLGDVIEGEILVRGPWKVTRCPPISEPHVIAVLHEEFQQVDGDCVQGEDAATDASAMEQHHWAFGSAFITSEAQLELKAAHSS